MKNNGTQKPKDDEPREWTRFTVMIERRSENTDKKLDQFTHAIMQVIDAMQFQGKAELREECVYIANEADRDTERPVPVPSAKGNVANN